MNCRRRVRVKASKWWHVITTKKSLDNLGLSNNMPSSVRVHRAPTTKLADSNRDRPCSMGEGACDGLGIIPVGLRLVLVTFHYAIVDMMLSIIAAIALSM